MAAPSTVGIEQTPRSFKVGVICGSVRAPRAGPQITTFVQQTIEAHMDSAGGGGASQISLELIDVATLGLSLDSEPGIPSKIHGAEGYATEATRRWSQRVAALDGFVFVTPQYNWGVPAGLKNAVDHLFHEWRGKPALVVSYGGHGGNHAAAALALVLGGGIGMRVVEKPLCLTFPGREFLVVAAKGQELGLDGASTEGPWSDRRADIAAAWDDLVLLLDAGSA